VSLIGVLREKTPNQVIYPQQFRKDLHSCRHTFGSRLAQQGVPLLTIKELMGHKTIEMTMRYSHLMPDHKREAVRNMRAKKCIKDIASDDIFYNKI
jgi:integrase